MLLADTFYAMKHALLAMVPLSADAMHMHVGFLLFFVIAAIARGERRFTFAFRTVLAICLAGEVLDFLYDLHAGNPLRWRNSIKDILGTMLWPGVWALLWTRVRAAQPAASRARPTPEASMPAATHVTQDTARTAHVA